ncbi:Plasmid pRiA4b ORF-3-like protein [Sphaerochaeta pleomorpha str. Grapes]|uniref:Plasmid pRiA4b ORF-3-like protein n=1 Tax=Sphaerochaeta pleomorpha (strain ATCC BAA-1885 / DSM 22778 / Grapes) TaxID=158190 RepID=G8QS81_SPHPG|nr:plasmid pRiA4b ORF-3 family protein [Sphaerochaeta pleomorpha]AEV28942.1 Plasmid pRiA4b ORF-3-like protein [Sphaerochaeta pleomorpha str. Grapes]
MKYQCTKAMLDNLGEKSGDLLPRTGDEDSFFAWHVNYCIWNRHKVVMAMNNLTHYCVFLYRLKPKDMARIEALLQEAIKRAFLMEGVSEKMIRRYFEMAGDVGYSQSANRSMTSKMNALVRDAQFNARFLDEKTIFQSALSLRCSRMYRDRQDRLKICQVFQMAMQDICGLEGNLQAVVPSLQVSVTLELEHENVFRRLIVPSCISFFQFHTILQEIFEWQNCHLHEFSLGNNDKITMDDFDDEIGLYGDGIQIREESHVLLKDVFPEKKSCTYLYDFGDSWQHEIIFEREITGSTLHATLLEMIGQAPPEDSGGPYGYEQNLACLKDREDPAYEETLQWVTWRTGYRYFYQYKKDKLPVDLYIW